MPDLLAEPARDDVLGKRRRDLVADQNNCLGRSGVDAQVTGFLTETGNVVLRGRAAAAS